MTLNDLLNDIEGARFLSINIIGMEIGGLKRNIKIMDKFPIYVVSWTYDQDEVMNPGIPYLYWNKEDALEKMSRQAQICPSHCHVSCYEFDGKGTYPGHPSQGWWTNTLDIREQAPTHVVFEK
jgi:hypothetical protein